MKKTLLIISAASLLLAGCAKEQLVEQKFKNGPVNVVSATFEDLVGDDATKAAVADAGTFTWQNGDKAAFAGESAYLEAQNSSTTATASFSYSGTLAASTYGIFPFDLTTDQIVNDGKVKVPTSRAWAENQTNVAMYATYASNNFSFAHLGGLVKVTINNVPTTATNFVFKTDGWKINGVFDIGTDTDSKKKISTSSTTTDSEMEYTLTFTAPSSESTSKVFYIPLPVGTYDKGFAVYLKDANGTILSQFKGSTSQSVNRKSFLIMPTITLASASIEDVYKDALVETIPAGYSGDFLLPETDKLILKIKASSENHDITLKYKGENKPANLEIKVVDSDTENPGNFSAKLLGNLPSTHVDFTLGHIDATELTTSSSTLAVINPATIGTLTVKGGNVVLKGATVNMIEVAEGAVADASSSTPVEIKMEKYTPAGSTVQTPKVTGSVVAKANVQVAPVAGETVTVVKVGSVTVEDTGEGTVEKKENEVSVSTFEDFENAVGNVVAGQTIKVTANISDAKGITVSEGKQFTVDFGGFTYTCASDPAGSDGTKNQVFQLLKNSTITFKNGTINLATTNQDKFRFLIQNYANLTLENMILDGTNLAITDRDRYTISNNCGTVEFKGNTTIKAAAQRGIAFDVCKNGSYTAPTVTWNSEGSVNGSIELTGGKFVVAKNLAVSTPVMAASGESTLEVGINASLSSTESFYDPNPNLSNHNSTAPVQVKQGAGLTVCGDGTIDGVKKAYSAVIVSINGDDDSKPAKLTVCGNVTLQGDYYGIVGNGNRHNTDITVNGGTVKGIHANDNIGIYHPQAGKLTISGGSIEGYSSAVEVRGGTVEISGGTLKSTATSFSCNANGSGSTTVGAALAIAQHNTKKDIKVSVTGGTFTGVKALNESNPQENDPAPQVDLSVSSGTFNGEISTTDVIGFIKGGTFSDLSGVNYVADNGTYKLANDVPLATPLEITSGKTFTIDLNSKTLTGRTNIKHGNVTFKNGNINGGNLQALNVYGSSESSVTNYSVVTVDSDATVTAEVFGVCLFGPTAGSFEGYGAGVDIKGQVTTTKTSSSNEGAVFVSGNLGGEKDANIQEAMEGKNFVNISGTVTSASDAALALQGSATATITGKLTGNTGIAAKRGKLIVKENAVITGNGSCVGNPTKNGNGTELTGSAVSASSTYGQRLAIDLQGGTYTSAAYTILNNADDAACSFTISGGKYETTKAGDGIAVYARLGSVNITGGEFINNSNSEATLHVGCPSADLSNGPRLTISGNDTVVKNNASGDYTYGGKPLVVNMANQLTYKAVEISGGKFYYRDPSKDDNVSGDNGNFLKSGYSATCDDTNVWTVAASQQN